MTSLLKKSLAAQASYPSDKHPVIKGWSFCSGGSWAPNVVLIFLDAVRYDASGLSSGSGHLAPNLSTFAEGALVFDNAYAVTTGLGAEHLEIDFNQQ